MSAIPSLRYCRGNQDENGNKGLRWKTCGDGCGMPLCTLCGQHQWECDAERGMKR